MNLEQFVWNNVDKKWIKEILSQMTVKLKFVKKDGSIREMNCTRAVYEIPVERKPKGSNRIINNDILPVYDVDLGEWRSFRYDSLKEIFFNLGVGKTVEGNDNKFEYGGCSLRETVNLLP